MAWYPGAERMELQPESDSQPAIRPTQLILHSLAASWTPKRTFEFWRDSTNLESHWGLGYDGSLAQYIGTQTRADACFKANLRSDGTGALSLESASNLDHTDPWTAAQIETIIRLGVWVHEHHGIPLRICRTWDDPGFGYHRMFPQWSDGGTACPGDARVKQFREVIFPGIVARANGQTTPTTPTPEEDDNMQPIDVWAYKGKGPQGEPETRDAYAYLRQTEAKVSALTGQVSALTEKVSSLETTGLTPEQITAIADAVLDGQAQRLAN
ncbi:peptidoglycan recognition protein family protein [Streptomyces goshikiensis]